MILVGIFLVMTFGAILFVTIGDTKEETPNISLIRYVAVIMLMFGVTLITLDIGYATKNSEWTLQETEVTDYVNEADTNGNALYFDEPMRVEYWKYDDESVLTVSRTKQKLIIKNY